MAKIYLIRHCESEGNACRRAQAQFNGLVTTKGFQQCEYLRRRFEGIHIDAIYSSDSYRSMMTAYPIAQERTLPISLRMTLREITTGVWEDMAWGDIPLIYPKEHRIFDSEPWNLCTPGGTTFQQASDLCIEGLRRIAREIGPNGTALAISHSCTIKSTLCKLQDKPMSCVKEFSHSDNTAVNLLHVDENGRIGIEYMNDCSHLPENLRRGWSGVAGADINMSFRAIHLPDEQSTVAKLLASCRMTDSSTEPLFSPADILQQAATVLPLRPEYAAIAFLKDEPCGFVLMDEDPSLPNDCGKLTLCCVKPHLRNKGYSEQLLGYAIHHFRFRGKSKLVMPTSTDPEMLRLSTRFLFAPMMGHPDYLSLTLSVPSHNMPVLS